MRISRLSKTGSRPIPNFGPQFKTKKVDAIGNAPVMFSLNDKDRQSSRFADDDDVPAKWFISKMFDFLLELMKMVVSAIKGQQNRPVGGDNAREGPPSSVPGGAGSFRMKGNRLGRTREKRMNHDGGGTSLKSLIPNLFSFLKDIMKMIVTSFVGKKDGPANDQYQSSEKRNTTHAPIVAPGSGGASRVSMLPGKDR